MRFICFAVAATWASACSPVSEPFESRGEFVLSPEAALARLSDATLLDVRAESDFTAGHVRGATRVDWRDFSEPNDPLKGRLLADDRVLGFLLSRAGVSNDRPVLVVGDPINGWGEDGRIVWMLRSLGHEVAALVDGGHGALAAAGAPTELGVNSAREGSFVVSRTAAFTIELEELARLVSSPGQTVILDGREAREYAGETPYGEARGGHVPGAKHLYFRDLTDARGRILPKDALWARLGSVGVSSASPVVAYCTGGVRSGWMVAVLGELGVASVRNFAGSMWEWAARPATEYPLVRE
ncbi:MAG: sulfurtransferase [Deltaproteobacteria bacterium]|nr:sulfurtransferase [Deltaproteobacteria bacterium]